VQISIQIQQNPRIEIDRWPNMNMTRWTAGLSSAALLIGLTACSRLKPQAPSSYWVDPQTAWHTVELTPAGMHYGLDAQGVSSNGPLRTVWVQKRSANSPYLYDKWQISLHCANRQWTWLMRTVVENNQVKAIEHDVTFDWDGNLVKPSPSHAWLPIKASSKEDKVMQTVCVNRR
jgi:hypothetical protein